MKKHQHQIANKRVSATGMLSGAGIDLIYCASGNKRFAKIAIDAGFLYGAQLPGTVYHPIYFADQNWKKPNRQKYMDALEKHRPFMATVLDFERIDQLSEVLSWAEEAARFVEVVMIIPKCFGCIVKLPHIIGNKPIRLAYSVPTRYGGTSVPVWEFWNRPVHLLGGSPQKQMRLRPYFDVRSVDGNMMQKAAVTWCGFWQPGTARYASNRWWPTLKESGSHVVTDAPYEAFSRSCESIMQAWLTL